MSWIISFLGRFDCKVQNKVIRKPLWHFCEIVQAKRWKYCQLTFMHIVIIQFFVKCNWKNIASLICLNNFIFFFSIFQRTCQSIFCVSAIGETDFFLWHTNACHFVFSAHNRNEINYAHRLTEIYKWLEWHFMWSKKKVRCISQRLTWCIWAHFASHWLTMSVHVPTHAAKFSMLRFGTCELAIATLSSHSTIRISRAIKTKSDIIHCLDEKTKKKEKKLRTRRANMIEINK